MKPPLRTAAGPDDGLGAFVPIWLGQTVSALGTGLMGFALAVRVFQETGSVTRYALLGLSIALPGLLCVPLAGYVADHWDRRRVIIVANLGAAANNFGLLSLILFGHLEIWFIYPVVLVSTACGVFAGSSLQASVTLLVAKKHFGRVSGMIQIRDSVVQILSPILAALLLEAIDLQGIVLINLVSYLFPPAVLAFTRLPRPEMSETGREAAGGGVLRQVRFGLSFIRQRPGLFRLLLIVTVANFAFAMVSALMTPLILGFSTPVMLGLVSSVAAAGALTGGILMSIWGGPRHRVRATLLGMLTAGFLLLLGGLRPSITLIASAAFFFMLCFPIVNGVCAVLWRSKVPPDVQGRVFAVRRLLATWSAPLALMLAGPLADRFFEPAMMPGRTLAAIFGGLMGVGAGRGIGLILVVMGMIVIVNVATGFLSPSLRRLEEEVPDVMPDEKASETPYGGEVREAAICRLGLVPGLVTTLLLAAAGALALAAMRPPPAVDPTAPATEFSAERAARHLGMLAREPHPVGSPAQRRVRDYLMAELDALGLETRIQRSTRVRRRGSLFQLVTVENVLARLPGRHRGPFPNPPFENRAGLGAVLLVAHYDSVPGGPGASDNGAAVAALLETARALTASEPLRADVLFLFSDAEETGLQGARAFVDEHPWADEVAVVLNFDARGRGGPVLMFETGPSNDAWMAHFAAGAPHPEASSMLNQIYRRLPNDTDFTVFRDAGYAGFNFAFIEGLTHYHSALDRPEEVSLESLQHQGSYALGLARELAALDLAAARVTPPSAERRDERAYFSLAGTWLVHYPRELGYLVAALAGGVFTALVALAWKRGRMTFFGMWQGVLAFLGQLVALPVAITLIWMLIRDIAGPPVLMGSTPAAAHYMSAFACLVVAFMAFVHRLLRRQADLLELAAGALFWELVITFLLCGVLLPVDANVVLLWPVCGALLSFGYFCLTPAETQRPWTAAGVLVAAALPGILLLVPFTATLYVGLQSLTELGGLPLVPAVLLVGLLLPHLELACRGRSWLPAAATLLGLAWLGLALARPSWLSPRGESRWPEGESSVFYAFDADSGEASWFSFDVRPSVWTRQFGFSEGARSSFAAFYPLLGRELLRHDAPRTVLPAGPGLEVIGEEQQGEIRHYHLRLLAADGARGRLIWLEPAGSAVSARLADTEVDLGGASGERSGAVMMELPILAPEEELTVRAADREPLAVTVIEQYDGLPRVPGLAPRPPGETVRPGLALVRSDVTLVRRCFRLDSTSSHPCSPPLEATKSPRNPPGNP